MYFRHKRFVVYLLNISWFFISVYAINKLKYILLHYNTLIKTERGVPYEILNI